jgi:hypothetical protein
VLRVGQLWKSSGPLADANAVSERPPGIGAWGEGLVDRSLTSLWYPADWNEVGDDELVFVLPTLSTWQTSPPRSAVKDGYGPALYLTRVLAARAQAAAELIAANMPDSATPTPALALEAIVKRNILTAITLKELAPPPPGSRNSPHAPVAAAADEKSLLPDWLVLELTAIAHLDRTLLDARGTVRPPNASPLVDWPLSLADVALATINARFNGVYVYPEFAHAHELLTAAALLGHLACGRSAYIPPHVAQSLIDLLSPRGKAANGGSDGCGPIMRTYADLAGGARHTLLLARRAVQSGRPLLARPRPAVAPSDTGRTTWNARLAHRIAQAWPVSA